MTFPVDVAKMADVFIGGVYSCASRKMSQEISSN